MKYDGTVTQRIVKELKNIENYKIDKIYQTDKNTIIIGVYGNGKNLAILANISANNYRLHLTNKNYKNPAIAMNFCMFLRKHILGYKIKEIYSKDLERIIFIKLESDDFSQEDELYKKQKSTNKTLIVELMGKHSNIILTDSNDIIIDSLRHTSTEENAQRDIYPTARYIMPKPSNNKWKSEEEIKIEENNMFSLNFAIDDFYYKKEQKEKFENDKKQSLSIILGILKKYEKRLENIEKKLFECQGMEKYRLYGELLTSNLYQIPKYNIESIEVFDYYNNQMIQIPLDKRYSPNMNAKRYFKKYTKLKNAQEIVNIQKNETIEDVKYLESIIYEIENCENLEEIEEIHKEIYETVLEKQQKQYKKSKKVKQMTKNKFASFNPLKYVIDGYTIYVGRNNKENDYLTNKFASKNDIWFHTKEIHGSHVILKTLPNEEVTKEVLYEAARLAAKHSKAKESTNVPVDYCLVKFVKKVPGNKPGLVIYSNNKTIKVT